MRAATRILLLAWLATVATSLFPAECAADVIVLANRARATMTIEVQPITARPMQLKLPSREVVPVFVDGRAYVNYSTGREVKRALLDANCAYYFGNLPDGSVAIQKIGLGGDRTTHDGRSLPGSAATAPIGIVPIKILVDEDEPARPGVWERRLRRRFEIASAVFEKYAGLKLQVVAVGRWESDDQITDFFESLSEFEDEVNPLPAQVAIGFTSQYQVPQGRTHLGGTRGPFHSHILIREWSQHVSESVRVELLLHELGHHFGASHSPELDSVMRPVLSQRQAADRQIRFDPVNTLVMAMMGEEFRRNNMRDLKNLSLGSKRRLRQIYGELSKAYPDDPAAKKFVQIVDVSTAAPLVAGTKTVLRSIVRAARENRKLPAATDESDSAGTRREGDQLTELYIRTAAEAAHELGDDHAASAFLLALGIGLDDSDMLRKFPKTKTFVGMVESAGERTVRLAFLGEPTMLGRRDLAKHFAVSAYLTAVMGSKDALSNGLAKEVLDAQGGTGFSFADLAANQAGILFAGGVLKKKFPLPVLHENFAVEEYMPDVDNLPEGLTAAQLLAQFGNQADSRFEAQRREISRRVMALPPYQLAGASRD